jgi:hypothetical protein
VIEAAADCSVVFGVVHSRCSAGGGVRGVEGETGRLAKWRQERRCGPKKSGWLEFIRISWRTHSLGVEHNFGGGSLRVKRNGINADTREFSYRIAAEFFSPKIWEGVGVAGDVIGWAEGTSLNRVEW